MKYLDLIEFLLDSVPFRGIVDISFLIFVVDDLLVLLHSIAKNLIVSYKGKILAMKRKRATTRRKYQKETKKEKMISDGVR